MNEEATAIVRPVETTAVDQVQSGGLATLALMSDGEFEQNLARLALAQDRIRRIHQTLMVEGVDYGLIPGTQKPTLMQPGAEKLLVFYKLVPRLDVDIVNGDGITTPPVSVTVTCFLHQGSTDGPVMGSGVGNCNSWERKYRYRRGERACPACGVIGAVIKGKAEYGGGWICFAKKGGCGAKFPDAAPEILEQVVGDIDNPDPYDLLNTLLKMAKKRALVDASKSTTGTSALYTQDAEDMDGFGAAGQDGAKPTRAAPEPVAPHQPPNKPDLHPNTAGAPCRSCNAPAGKPHAAKCAHAASPPNLSQEARELFKKLGAEVERGDDFAAACLEVLGRKPASEADWRDLIGKIELLLANQAVAGADEADPFEEE